MTRFSIALLLAALAAGCGGGGARPADREPIQLSRDVQPVLTLHCANGSCHAGPNPFLGLDLSPGRSYGDLVGVQSVYGSYLRVDPGLPDSSVVWGKINGDPRFGIPMPTSIAGLSAPPLSQQEIDLIGGWILEGAPDD